MSVTVAPAPVVDLRSASGMLEAILALPAPDRQMIAAWSLNTIDYSYWLKKATAAAVAADPAAAELIAQLPANPGEHGPVIAELCEPLIGQGVHRAQLQLLSNAFDLHIQGAL